MFIKKDYYTLLFEQYTQAKGIKAKTNFKNKTSVEFIDWLKIQKELIKEYSKRVQTLGIIDKDLPLLELGQGALNSATEFLLEDGFKVTAITPFEAEFSTSNVKATRRSVEFLNTLNDVGTYMIQLPIMTKEDYINFMIDNCKRTPIIIGAYGENNDANKYRNVMKMIAIKNQIADNFGRSIEIIESNVDDNGQYIHILGAKRK